jgi:hypothetical protein
VCSQFPSQIVCFETMPAAESAHIQLGTASQRGNSSSVSYIPPSISIWKE